MKKIYDKNVTDRWLEKTRLLDCFDTKELGFFVIHYQQGEFLLEPEQPVTYFQFIVKGSAVLYYLDEDGARRNVVVVDNRGILGDMEFVMGGMPIFYTEAITPVTVLALPMEENRSKLEKDCRFLMYLLRQESMVKIFASRNEVVLPRLEERLVYHLKNECPNQMLIGMENTAVKLQCSRRQLQRVVKKLEGQGRLKKCSRGCYQLQENKRCHASRASLL